MRQEPIVYVNGNPVCARPPNKIGEYAELGNVTRASVKSDEEEFIKVIEGRAKADGELKVVDVSKKESELEVKELITLSKVMEGLKEKYPGLTHNRIPVCNSAAPLEPDFDTICNALSGTNVNTPVIVNCQVGLSRSTTGCVAACLFREFQLSASYQGLVETVPGVNLEVLRMDKYTMDPEKDTLFRGEFEVVKELIAAFEDGPASKAECDKVIDKNGPPPKGTGIKQLREKSKAAKDAGAEEFKLSGGKASVPTENLKLAASFCTYMDAHPNFRTICEEGKGKLQWERDIPQDALDNLVSLANADFHANLGKIIHDIYLTGHNLFKDMPQGDHGESQISLCFQDFNENFARQLEDRSRKPYQPKDNDFGSLRNPWPMHMGTRNKRCLNLSSFDYQLRTIHTVCF